MNAPSIPTDNLYKFLALTGVLMIILSVASVEMQLARIARDDVEIALGKEALSYRLDQWDRVVDLLLAEPPAGASTHLVSEINAFREEIMALRKRSDMADVALKEARAWRWFAYLGAVVGLAMSTTGFRLWYLRLQRYQDMIIKREAEGDT